MMPPVAAVPQSRMRRLRPIGVTGPESLMRVDCVARAVVCMPSLPLDANVLCLTVMATTMPVVGRG